MIQLSDKNNLRMHSNQSMNILKQYIMIQMLIALAVFSQRMGKQDKRSM